MGVEKVGREKFVSGEVDKAGVKEQLYEIIVSDRDNVEKAKRAFVSYVRAYK